MQEFILYSFKIVPLQYDRQRDTNIKTRRSQLLAEVNTAFCVLCEWENENNLNISLGWIESTTIIFTVFIINHNASPEK